jgi:hypothetical protein
VVVDQSLKQPKKGNYQMTELKEHHRPNLMLYGSKPVERIAVARTSTPKPTSTWVPIPHVTLVETVESSLRAVGLQIGQQVHSLDLGGSEYFGLTEVRGQNTHEDFSWVLGVRNSHSKRFPAGIVAGANVFVCSNLSFSGEVKLSRRHTAHLMRDLPQMSARAVGLLMDCWHHQDQRIEAYKSERIRDKTAHDLVIRAVDVGACTNRMIPAIIKEWREPRHSVFTERNVWSLFNGFTEILKSGKLDELPKRTQALHGLMDNHVGLPAAHLN